MHSGGTTALFPLYRKVGGKWKTLTELGGWKFMHNNHYYPSSKQVQIFNHLDASINYLNKTRGNKKLIIVNDGDAIEGVHHNTPQLATANIGEQKDVHIELMKYIMERLGYRRGDLLAYVSGTNSHVGDEENGIATQLGAMQYEDGFYSTSFLRLNVNGVLSWVFHTGVGTGKHPNIGNPMVNFLRKTYYETLSDNAPCPRVIVSGHVHNPYHAVYNTPNNFDMHYIILPSMQSKTGYAREKMPTEKNKIGLQFVDISADGVLNIHPALLAVTPDSATVTV